MAASGSRCDRPTAHAFFEVHCSSARRTPDGQMFDAICINISESVQADAAVMVTIGAVMVTLGSPQCRTRAKSKHAPLRQAGGRGCAIMSFWSSVLAGRVSV